MITGLKGLKLMQINKKSFERWEIFHDGCHNYDKYAPGCSPDGKDKYLLDVCAKCGNVKEHAVKQFLGQGTICIKLCKCKEEDE